VLQLHWLGLKEQPPERYAIYNGRLMRTREPGFVVQGFLWCGARDEPQYDPLNKRVKPLDGDWPDKATQDIVSAHVNSMQRHSGKTACRDNRRNRQRHVPFVWRSMQRLVASTRQSCSLA
jgi:hypothetical protein